MSKNKPAVEQLDEALAWLAQEPDSMIVTHASAVLNGLRSSLIAEESEAVRLRAGLKELAAFASAHHADEESCRWLHALTVDIPANVEHLLGEDERPVAVEVDGEAPF